jgi:hypothetical protein
LGNIHLTHIHSRTVFCATHAGSARAYEAGKNGITVDGRVIGKPAKIGGIEITGTKGIELAKVRDVAILLEKKAGHIRAVPGFHQSACIYSSALFVYLLLLE